MDPRQEFVLERVINNLPATLHRKKQSGFPSSDKKQETLPFFGIGNFISEVSEIANLVSINLYDDISTAKAGLFPRASRLHGGNHYSLRPIQPQTLCNLRRDFLDCQS